MGLHSELKKKIATSKHIVFLTGAGISTASGIPDFQTMDLHWKEHLPRHEILSNRFLYSNPSKFWEVFRVMFMPKSNLQPNLFHHYLTELSKEVEKMTVITQNVDGLHAKAGNPVVHEVHGNLSTAYCETCGGNKDLPSLLDSQNYFCQKCFKPYKPNVVLFGDPIRLTERDIDSLGRVDVLIVAGTSLKVSPVNRIPLLLKNANPDLFQVWVNREQFSNYEEYDSPIINFDMEILEHSDSFANSMSNN